MEIDELRRLSAKEGLSLNYIAKDEKVSQILANLQEFDDIVLKGGTAINRIYAKNKRFSEDIDFDIIFKGNVRSAITRTKEIVSKLSGFDISKPRIMKQTIRYDLYYQNPLNHRDRIMLEFTAIKKSSNYDKKIVNFGFVPHESALLNVYDIKQMIMFKIDCLLNRLEGKDFFDLYYLIELPHKHIKIPKQDLIKRLDFDDKEIKSIADVINHYVPKSKRPAWSIFVQELKEKIQNY